jgi:hypothetical protein
MDKIYTQILDKIENGIKKPEFKQVMIQHIINPMIQDIYSKTHNYFITIISLYSITILLLLLILSIIISKKKLY